MNMRKIEMNKTKQLDISRKEVLTCSLIVIFLGAIIFLMGSNFPPEFLPIVFKIYGGIWFVLGFITLIITPLIPKDNKDNAKNET